MSWKKHFTVYQGTTENLSSRQPASSASQNKFASWLPEIYAGAPNRHERYLQYDQMDQDSEINAALDIIAEFCTQTEDGGLPFKINYNETPPPRNWNRSTELPEEREWVKKLRAF